MVDSLADVEAEEKEQKRIDFNFPLLIVRTRLFDKIFDRLGNLRASKLISWVALAIVPIVAVIGLYLLSTSLITILSTPAARDISRQLGPTSFLLLPGINPILPVVYGWVGIVSAIIIHEGAHGIIARNRGFDVKSSGILFFLIIPIGAFVDVDEKQIAKANAKDSLRVMAGGVAGNVIVALVCIIAVLLIVNGLTPIVNGVYITSVTKGMPAQQAGLIAGDIFISVDNVSIKNYDLLANYMENKTPGDVIHVTVARGTNWKDNYSTSLTLTQSDSHAVMGVNLIDLMTNERLKLYSTLNLTTVSIYIVPPSVEQGLVPFSDSLFPFYSSPLGSQWHVYANIFFWVWFVNVNVAVFNALPIIPLDGGRMLNISLKSFLAKKLNEKTISRITYVVTAILICILLSIIVIPFVL